MDEREWVRSELRGRVYHRQGLHERFDGRFEQRGPDECWPWTRGMDKNGYGLTSFGHDGERRAHRIAYRLAHGDIPDGHRIDHTCHNASGCTGKGLACPHRRCVNPAHLEAVPHRVNLLRGLAPEGTDPDEYVRFCKNHHPRTPENTYTYPSGRRACRACRREQKAERRRMAAS